MSRSIRGLNRFTFFTRDELNAYETYKRRRAGRGWHGKWTHEAAARQVILTFVGSTPEREEHPRGVHRYTASMTARVYFGETVTTVMRPQVLFRPMRIMAYVHNPVLGHRVVIERLKIGCTHIFTQPVPVEMFQAGAISRIDVHDHLPLADSIEVDVSCKLDRKVWR